VSQPASVRLPFAPLAIEAQAATIETLAQRLGVSRRTVHRWIIHGIPAEQAD
jgi:response regulator of citrate/malate metabolism